MGRPKKQVVESMQKAEKEMHKACAPQDYSHVKERAVEPTAQFTKEQKSRALKITFGRSIKVVCKREPTEKEKKEREYGWEYVEGIFENRALFGESLTFWLNPYPGDPSAEWTIPCNILIAVPRWVANHLNTRKYVTFKSKDKNVTMREASGADIIAANFEPHETIHRTTFMPARAYG